MKKFKLMLPMLAGILGLSIYVANAMEERNSVKQVTTDQSWILNNPNDDPTNPENYSPYSGNLSTFCPGAVNVCGIVAPSDGDHPSIPEDSELMERIENKDTSELDVFLRN